MADLRKTGIDIIDDVHWGTHFCQFYQTKEDLIEILVPYFKAGLENNEFCIWITSQPMRENEAREALREAVPDVDRYIGKGQLEIYSYEDWYLQKGEFDSQRVLNSWIDKLNKALSSGYDGMRLTGNTFWLERKDWRGFVAYEEEIDSLIGKYPMMALCSYSLDKCRAAEVIDVINNHQFALIKQEKSWTLIENSQYKIATERLRESEARFRALVTASSDVVYRMSPDWKVMRQLQGRDFIPDTESPGSTWLEKYIHPDDQAHVLAVIDESIRTKSVFELEHRVLRADGTLGWTRSRSIPVLDADGQVIEWFGTARGITKRKQAEEELKRTSDRLHVLTQNVSSGVALIDEHGRFSIVNPAFLRMFGLSEESDAMNLDSRSLANWQVFEENGTILDVDEYPVRKAVLTGKAVRNRLVGVRGPSGPEIRWVLISAEPIFKQDGRLDVTICTYQDITERKLIEEKIRRLNEDLERKVLERTADLVQTTRKMEEQKELLQTIIDHIPVIVTLCDSQGRIRLVNKEFERLTGWSLDDTHAREVAAGCFPHPPYRKEVVEIIATAKPGWHEFDVTTRSGDTLRILWASVRLSEGHVGIGIDVTEQKKMQTELLRLAAAVDQTGEAVVLRSPEGVVEYVNPAFEKISGYSRDEMLGKKAGSIPEYFAGHDIQELLNRVARDGKPWSGRQTRRRKTGETVFVDVFISPVCDAAGRIIDLISLIRDATQEVRMQQQLAQAQRMDAIGNLAGGIAHDLKNILTPILINTEMALEDVGSNHPAYPMLEEALGAAKLGRDLVQQILTFSRRAPHKKVPVNISEVIGDTMGFLRSTLPSTIEIHNELKDDCVVACADPTQIKQVLINLGANAGHAMREQGGILDVSESRTVLSEEEAARISPDLAPGAYIQVEVQDTGYGMDEQTMQHIFEPFFTTKKGEGTGMGLAVAHGIVREHQGAITVKSKPGEGSLFTVLLPMLEDGSEDRKCLPPKEGR